MVTSGLSENELQAECTSACEKLQRLFSGALWDQKVNSCFAAWSEIKRANGRKKKIEVLEEKAREWREGSVKAIREWLPKFVKLAQAFPEAAGRDELQWAKDRVWKVVEGQCGISPPKQGDVPRVDLLSRAMVFWFAVASEGNIKVNLPPLRPWTAPHWLARNRTETHSLLRSHTEHLSLRLNYAIEEELTLAEVHRAINRRNPDRREDRETIREAAKETQGIAQGTTRRSDVWRSFHLKFKALADAERTEVPDNAGDRWLRAYVSYQERASEFGYWQFSRALNETFRARFEVEATRAGVALGVPAGTKPLDFWLHHLFLDLLESKSKLLSAAAEGEGGIIVRVCEASAMYCARLEKRALESVNDWGPEQVLVAKESLSPSPRRRGLKKPGRVPRLASDFVDLAGRRWLEAMRQRPEHVSLKQLATIGAEMDEKGYIPPADYLEGHYARELKLFNSRNSNSRTGAIKTWTQLILLADKDHLRGMRRLLSRCAEKHHLS